MIALTILTVVTMIGASPTTRVSYTTGIITEPIT